MIQDDLDAFWFFRTLASKKIGRAVTSQSSDKLLIFIDSFCDSLGIPAKVVIPLAVSLKAYLNGEVTHADTTVNLLESVPRLVAVGKVRPLLAIANLVGAFGLFHVSQQIECLAINKLRTAPHMDRLARSSWVTRRLQASLLAGDIEAATQLGVTYENRNRKKLEASESYRVLSDYAGIIGGRGLKSQHVQPSNSPDTDDWKKEMTGKSFLVVGPGEILDDSLKVSEFDYVVRTVGAGTYDWKSISDPFEGRAEIVYLNPENLEYLREASSQDPKLLSGVNWVCVKKSAHLSLPTRIRSVNSGGLLFLRGHANLIPLICVDLSRLPGTTISVVGSTFFASTTAYRPDSVRVRADGRRVMESGS